MDEIDRISQGRKLVCDVCGHTVEDMDMGVALGIMQNHMERKHPTGQALKIGKANN